MAKYVYILDQLDLMSNRSYKWQLQNLASNSLERTIYRQKGTECKAETRINLIEKTTKNE